VDKLVVKGRSFLAVWIEGLHHYASQLDGAEIHFHLLHLPNDYAVSHMDGALPNFGQRHTCLGFRFAVGPTHHLREFTLLSRGQTPLPTLGS
jgi:hypothetical protein